MIFSHKCKIFKNIVAVSPSGIENKFKTRIFLYFASFAGAGHLPRRAQVCPRALSGRPVGLAEPAQDCVRLAVRQVWPPDGQPQGDQDPGDCRPDGAEQRHQAGRGRHSGVPERSRFAVSTAVQPVYGGAEAAGDPQDPGRGLFGAFIGEGAVLSGDFDHFGAAQVRGVLREGSAGLRAVQGSHDNRSAAGRAGGELENRKLK